MGYVIMQALRSLVRNFWLSVASIMTMMISLAILGFAIIVLDNTGNVAKSIESQVQIVAYFGGEGRDNDAERALAIENEIRTIKDVVNVSLDDPRVGMEVLAQERSKSVDELMLDYGGINPLPYKFVVDVSDGSLVVATAEQIEKIEGVYKADYGQGILEKILNLTSLLRTGGVLIVAVFGFAAFVLITLNIRANVFSREKEIQIMRLVGASNAFIRGPFFVEGMLVGLIGALVAVVVVGSGYTFLAQFITREMSFLPIVAESQILLQVLTIMLVGGILIGISASMVSMRRFLKL